ncbi:MAG: nucleotidyltransferase family protein [Anaerolineaceae bacterium]|nr:nucleotidyltransferase family protein [Anaerolineaceae bacterium]
MKRSVSNCWPTPVQELMLRAALLKGEGSIKDWKAWTKIVEFNDIDHGSQRLLPLLYRNLLDQGIQSPLMARYKGVYRRFWSSNQFLFNRTKSVLIALQEAGIDPLLFKGVGLVISCNLNFALRPMDDIDLLVPEETAQTAINIIREMGWAPKFGGVGEKDPIIHAVTYRDGKGHAVDLHWHSLSNVGPGKYEQEYWNRSFNGLINDAPVEVMGITDQLIHTVVHGIRWNAIPPIRWIADAIILLTNSERSIDWDHLIKLSGILHVTIPMYEGLSYLKKEFNASVPVYVLQSLKRFPVSRREKRNYQLNKKKPIPVFGQFILKIGKYLTYYQGKYPFPGFPRYLQDTWGLKNLWQIPFDGVFRMWRRIRIDLFKQKFEDVYID